MEEILKRYIDATNTHDFNEVAKCLSENAVYYFTNKTCIGIEEIKAYFENTWSIIKDEKYWATNVNWLHSDENNLICVYQYNYSGYINNKHVDGFGRATNIFTKEISTNRWVLIHEHLSHMPASESI